MNTQYHIEIWKEVPGYPNYQVSTLGKVRSFKKYPIDGIILKLGLNQDGYLRCGLSNGVSKRYKVHQWVAITFLNHKPDGTAKIIVDHIDNNKLNNNLSNLQLITARENTSKDKSGCTSNYTGVSWYGPTNKWVCKIVLDGKNKHLGTFTNEEEASETYQKALKMLNDGYDTETLLTHCKKKIYMRD